MLHLTLVALACWASSVHGEVDVQASSGAPPVPQPAKEEAAAPNEAEVLMTAEEKVPKENVPEEVGPSVKTVAASADKTKIFAHPRKSRKQRAQVKDKKAAEKVKAVKQAKQAEEAAANVRQNADDAEGEEEPVDARYQQMLGEKKLQRLRAENLKKQIHTQSDQILVMIGQSGVMGPEGQAMGVPELKAMFHKQGFQEAMAQRLQNLAQQGGAQIQQGEKLLQYVRSVADLTQAFYVQEQRETMQARGELPAATGAVPRRGGRQPRYQQGRPAGMPNARQEGVGSTDLFLFALWCGASGFLVAAVIKKFQSRRQKKSEDKEGQEISLVDV